MIMTAKELKEALDKLPLSIEYNGKEYFLHIECERKKLR